MGTKAQGILKISPEEVIKLLNGALADEWLAVMQYWLGAQLYKGPQKKEITQEFLLHMQEELTHADKLSQRIIQLGGVPVINPKVLAKAEVATGELPEDSIGSNVLSKSIRGEQHAILYYNSVLEVVRGKDPVTHALIVEILSDEIEHEQDLEDLIFEKTC